MKPAQIAKGEVITNVKEKLAAAKAVLAVDYRGLTVAQISDLRHKLRAVGGQMLVAKNTLILRALKTETGTEKRDIEKMLSGPTAVVFSVDEVSAPKVVSTFAKTAGLPGIKGGLLGDRVLTADEVKALAEIPGRETLNAKLVGILAGGPTRLVWTLNGSIARLVRALDQVSAKKSD